MDYLQAVLLAVVQGLTEFLPISSSGHLILVPALLGWPDQGLAFDIAVHLGSLIAVVAYFRRDLFAMAVSLTRFEAGESRLARQILFATVPLGLAGIAFADLVETTLRSPLVIAASTAGFGLLLWAGDLMRRQRGEHSLTWTEAMLIGCGQALALIPGTSRSGITMTCALALGLNREAASRFAFLLSIPAIAMVAVWQSVELALDPAPIPWIMLGLATALAALTAFGTIALFLDLIGRVGMGVFALYRLLLAGVLVYVFL